MNPSSVTPGQFIAWREQMHYSQGFAAQRLGLSASCVRNYERGLTQKAGGRVVPIPRVVALAMSALSNGLMAYGE